MEDGLSAAVREKGRWKERGIGREDGQVARMTLGFVLDMPKGVGTAIR